MKRFLVFFFLLVASGASADYQPVQVLTASGVKPVGTVASICESLPVDARITSATIGIPVAVVPFFTDPTGVATNAYLDSSKRILANIGSMTIPIPSGTNVIGKAGIDQTTPGTTNGVQPASAALGSASANTVSPMAVQLMGSDNTLLQRLFTAIVQADGVNGNNMLPFVQYLWNGASFDRARNPTSPGILGTFTLSIPLDTAVALPTAPAGSLNCHIFPTQDVNFRNSEVASGTGEEYFFQLIPGQGFYGYSDFTDFYLIGRTAIATATGYWD